VFDVQKLFVDLNSRAPEPFLYLYDDFLSLRKHPQP
jgi:hypothetical protein